MMTLIQNQRTEMKKNSLKLLRKTTYTHARTHRHQYNKMEKVTQRTEKSERTKENNNKKEEEEKSVVKCKVE